MKQILIIFLLFAINNCLAQEPGIDSVKVFPANPTKNDPIKIAVYVATPTPSKRVNLNYNVYSDTIDIRGCYAIKSSSATMNFFADTLSIGPLNDLTYKVIFTAYRNIDTLACNGIFDSNKKVVTVTVLPPNSINELLPRSTFDIYPNPAHDVVFLNYEFPKTACILSMQGRVVKTFSKNMMRLDISDIPAGFYLLRVETNNESFVRRLLKE